MSWTLPGYERVALMVGRKTGLSFTPSRRASVEQGISRAMRRARVDDLAAYQKLLDQGGPALDDLIAELTVGETYFFREPAQFAFLRREVLPGLRHEPGVRVWSAGCASGEEAFSLAILLQEENLAEHALILATDLSHAALAKARQGVYTDWSLRGEEAAPARRHLRPQGARWAVSEALRRRVTFAHLNLAQDVYPSFASRVWGMNLILCRNVLIYFDPDTIQAVVRRLFDVLAPGGWLVTASSDPSPGPFAPFECVLAEEGVFYRRPRSAGLPVSDVSLRPCTQGRGVEDEGFLDSSPRPCTQGRGVEDEGVLHSSPRPCTQGRGVGGEGCFNLPGQRHPLTPAPSPPSTGARGEEKASRPPIPSPPREREEEKAPANADPLAEAQSAFARGEYDRVVQTTAPLSDNPNAWAIRLRALANLDLARAQQESADAVARHPLQPELHHLQGTLLLAGGRDAEAAGAFRRALYLDRSLAAVHCALGAVLERCGDRAGACRAYRNARDLSAARPADEEVPFAEGERAGQLAEAARARLAQLGEAPSVEVSP